MAGLLEKRTIIATATRGHCLVDCELMGDWSVGHKPRHPGHESGQWHDPRDSSGRLQQRRSQSARGATERFLPPAAPSPSTSRLTAPASRASALSGHLGETVEVVVTNGYAAMQIDKTTSSATVVPGGQITYTLQATNTGGLTLHPVVVSDRLPSMMELVSASVAGGAGECHLTETTRPQLLTCTMSGSLAPGAVTSLITLVVNVDSTVAVGSTIVNQAMVHGAYAADAVLSGLGSDFELSCLPVVSQHLFEVLAPVRGSGREVADRSVVAHGDRRDYKPALFRRSAATTAPRLIGP